MNLLQGVLQKEQRAGVVMFHRALKKPRKTPSVSIFSLSLCEEQIRDTNMIFKTKLCSLNCLPWFRFAMECHTTYLLAVPVSKTLGLADALRRNW